LLAALVVALTAGFVGVFNQWQRAEGLYGLSEARRANADAERDMAQANLRRYEQAADDFARLIDTLETDQLFHLRSDPLRPELVIPALRRNEEFLARFGDDPARQAEAVRAHFRVAVLTRVLCANRVGATYDTALAASQAALIALTAFAGERPTVVQYQRDRAALTQSIGYLLHATKRSAEGVPVLEDACRQRQALLDAEPNQLDYRSELGSCWNDLGLALSGAERYAEAVTAYERAAELQKRAVDAAPQVPRYWRHLGNHHFNRAMALVQMDRASDAAAAAAEGPRLMPHDPEQWFREARVLALLARRPDGAEYVKPALASLRRAVDLGFDQLNDLDGSADLSAIRSLPSFQAIRADLVRKRTGPPSPAP
jgi:tetratricopeptide (TPR) repeat protein